jgi:hypothetical protein
MSISQPLQDAVYTVGLYPSCPFNNSIDLGAYGLKELYLVGNSEDFYMVIVCTQCSDEHEFKIVMKANEGKLLFFDC